MDDAYIKLLTYEEPRQILRKPEEENSQDVFCELDLWVVVKNRMLKHKATACEQLSLFVVIKNVKYRSWCCVLKLQVAGALAGRWLPFHALVGIV